MVVLACKLAGRFITMVVWHALRSPQALQALEAGAVAALPDAVRVELESIQSGGGVQHLQEVAQQIRVRRLVSID
jgi:hypothetical protein